LASTLIEQHLFVYTLLSSSRKSNYSQRLFCSFITISNNRPYVLYFALWFIHLFYILSFVSVTWLIFIITFGFRELETFFMNNYCILTSVSTPNLLFISGENWGGYEMRLWNDLQAISALFYVVTKSVSKDFVNVRLFTAKYHFIHAIIQPNWVSSCPSQRTLPVSEWKWLCIEIYPLQLIYITSSELPTI
jgi:hypothetical protein